ncbi:Hap4 transcription factor, heteromerisation domain [Phaffia rhodozyma]|uniref:Hap4 transcription factor, heteromerisation domain n=1 Tax=Phaffia rhodozyma TaxID=264483 RepID=A0A0F7SE77_PHARH|nr:Hap4 transcription factor, heteromerisation domain [Phaffia rhodozyma]
MAPSASDRDTSSSGGKIFAKASKEWTIPPRPRPGRKASEPAAKPTGKGAQNRDAQRAFRERKQDYVQELENKIKEYEAQEVQKAISLQTVSLALKAENTTLKSENARLRSLVMSLGGDPTDSPQSESTSSMTGGKGKGKRKRSDKSDRNRESPETEDGGDEPVTPESAETSPLVSTNAYKPEHTSGHSTSSVSSLSSNSSSSNGNGSGLGQQQQQAQLYHPRYAYPPLQAPSFLSPSLYAAQSSPQALPTGHFHTQPSALPNEGQTRTTAPSSVSSTPRHVNTTSTTKTIKTTCSSSSSSEIQIVPCGFCTQNDTCVCRIAAEQKERERLNAGMDSLLIDMDSSSPNSSSQPSEGVDTSTTSALRIARKPKGKTSTSIWTIDSGIVAGTSSTSSSTEATSVSVTSGTVVSDGAVLLDRSGIKTEVVELPSCTGDPSNCAACADDPFGKAFCETLDEDEEIEEADRADGAIQVKEEKKSEMIEVSCCGVPGACGSHQGECGTSEKSDKDVLMLGGPEIRVPHGPIEQEKQGVPTADVWRQLKSHPNATFADLSLLAAVCSRRLQTFTSPSPAPSTSSLPPLDSVSPNPHTSSPYLNGRSTSLTPSAGSTSNSISAAVAQAQAHKRRRLEIDAEGVKEALRILDARGGGVASGAVDGGAVVEGLKRGRRVSDLRGTLGEIKEESS